MVITVRTGESLFEVGKDLRGERRAHGRHLVAKSAQFADLAIRLEVLQHLRMRNNNNIYFFIYLLSFRKTNSLRTRIT
jgi:hypothetical protein